MEITVELFYPISEISFHKKLSDRAVTPLSGLDCANDAIVLIKCAPLLVILIWATLGDGIAEVIPLQEGFNPSAH